MTTPRTGLSVPGPAAAGSPVAAGAADGYGLDLRRPKNVRAKPRRLNGPAHRPGHSQEHHQRRDNPGTD